MNKIKTLLVATTALLSINANASSQAECAIWLCAPLGFSVPGCHTAFKAMIRRVRHFKSPVPSLGSCMVSGNAGVLDDNNHGFSSTNGRVAFINHNKNNVVYNTTCRRVRHHHHHHMQPSGCTGSGYYVQMFENGKSMQNMKPFAFSIDDRY